MRLAARLKPASGFSHLIHIGLTILLPLLVYIFVRLNFVPLAVAIILLSKWRMLAVKPRYWLANIRANAVDITVSLSFLIFITHSGSQLFQLIWTVGYAVWLLFLKPRSDLLGITAQAGAAELMGMTGVFMAWGGQSALKLVILSWLVNYAVASHFFTSFDEPLTRYLSYLWAYFGAALVWVLSHWLLFYGSVAQPAVLLTVIGFGLAGLYYLEETDRLSVMLRRQFIFVVLAIVIIILVFSDWGDKIV